MQTVKRFTGMYIIHLILTAYKEAIYELLRMTIKDASGLLVRVD
jgi:hypothetical protein